MENRVQNMLRNNISDSDCHTVDTVDTVVTTMWWWIIVWALRSVMLYLFCFCISLYPDSPLFAIYWLICLIFWQLTALQSLCFFDDLTSIRHLIVHVNPYGLPHVPCRCLDTICCNVATWICLYRGRVCVMSWCLFCSVGCNTERTICVAPSSTPRWVLSLFERMQWIHFFCDVAWECNIRVLCPFSFSV